MSNEELLINKVFWIVFIMQVHRENGTNFVTPDEVHEKLDDYKGYISEISLKDVEFILKSSEKYNNWWMPYYIEDGIVKGYALL